MNVFHISAAKICKIPWSPIRSVRCAFEYISSNWCRFCFNNAGKRIENTRIENWAMRSYWLSFKLWQRTTCYICLAFMYHETYHSLHRIIRARTSESTFPLIIVSTTRYVKTYNITWVMIYKKQAFFCWYISIFPVFLIPATKPVLIFIPTTRAKLLKKVPFWITKRIEEGKNRVYFVFFPFSNITLCRLHRIYRFDIFIKLLFWGHELKWKEVEQIQKKMLT